MPFFAVLLFLGSVFRKFSGANFCLLGSVLVLCLLGGILLRFLLYVLTVRSRKCLENSLDVRSCVFRVCALFLWFFCRRHFVLFFSRDTAQVVTGHPHTHLVCLFLFFLSRCACFLFALFGRASCFLVVFRGAILGPARFWHSPRTYGARACSPLRPLFLGREAARVFFVLLVLGFVFFPFCFAATHFLEGPGVVSLTRRVVLPTPRRVTARGRPSLGRGPWTPPFWGFCRRILSARGLQGPSDASRPGPFFWGRGRLSAPSTPVFHTRLCFCLFSFLGLWGHTLRIARRA